MLETPWYYRIEVEPGVFTPGTDRPNLAVCREIMERIDLHGKRCLDIGTQEFVAPIVMRYSGASDVVAYDRLNKLNRLDYLKRIYDFDIEYICGVELDKLRKQLESSEIGTAFDFVNFSGVLYHMVDPLSGLANARSFLRDGGIMLLETAASFKNTYSAEFNAKGELYGISSNYFLPSLSLLDYFVRMLRMAVLDVIVFGRNEKGVGRCALVLRGMAQVQPEPGDDWMHQHWIEKDFAACGLLYSELVSNEEDVRYLPSSTHFKTHPGTTSIDVYRSHLATPSYRLNRDLMSLKLAHVGR
jgi:SAM-dependent methyltransferase